MGVFQRLKQDQPIELKALNEVPKYSADFKKAKTSLEFIGNSIESRHNPKLFCRRYYCLNQVHQNKKALDYYLLNQFDLLNTDLEFEVKIAHRKLTVDKLTEDTELQR